VISRPSRGFAGILSAGAANAMEEALQEGFQGIGENVLARNLFDPDRDVTEGVAEAMKIGAILGFGAGAVGGAVNTLRGGQQVDGATDAGQPDVADQADVSTVDVVDLVRQQVGDLPAQDPSLLDPDAINLAPIDVAPETDTVAPEQAEAAPDAEIAEAAQEAATQAAEAAQDAGIITPEDSEAIQAETAEAVQPERAEEVAAEIGENTAELQETLAMAVRRGLTPDQVAEIETILAKQAPDLVEPFRLLVQEAQDRVSEQERQRTEAKAAFTEELRTSLRGVTSKRASGQNFTGGQVAIADAWQAYRERTGANVSLDAFKQQIMAASRGANPGFYLTRLDMPSLMDADLRKASATRTRGGDEVHFINFVEQSQAAEQLGEAPAEAPTPAGQQPAPIQNLDDIRRQFTDIIDSKIPRAQWHKKLGITEAQLAPLIDEQVEAGRLRRVKGGKVWRVAKSKQTQATQETGLDEQSNDVLEQLRSDNLDLDATKAAIGAARKLSKAQVRELAGVFTGVTPAKSRTKADMLWQIEKRINLSRSVSRRAEDTASVFGANDIAPATIPLRPGVSQDAQIVTDRTAHALSYVQQRIVPSKEGGYSMDGLYSDYQEWASASKTVPMPREAFGELVDGLLRESGVDRFMLGGKVRYPVILNKDGGSDIAPSAITGRLPDQPSRQPSAGLERPSKGLAEIVHDLNRTLGIATRQGRLDPKAKRQARQAGADLRGQASRTTGVVRLAVPNEIDTLAHEGGHALENRFGSDLEAIKQQFEGELRPLASGVAMGEQLSEGFAEWFRRYATNRQTAENTAPGFTQAFEEFLDANDPGMLQGLQEIEASYQEWIRSPSGGAIAQSIKSSVPQTTRQQVMRELKEDGLGETLDSHINKFYTQVFDDLHPVRMAVDHLLQVAARNLNIDLAKGERLGVKGTNDAYKLLRLARDGYSAGHMDLLYGVHPHHGVNPEGPGLREAMAKAFGGTNKSQWSQEMAENFGAYLVSRRMVAEWQRFIAGDLTNAPDKFSLADHQENIAAMEAQFPQFTVAAQDVYAFNRNMLTKKRDAGLISEELYDQLLQKVDYVPAMRDMGPRKFFDFSGLRGQNKHSIINRFRGSQRDVINPLESITKDAYETSMLIARNDAIKALDALARSAGPGGGAIAERIPAKQMRATQVDAIEALRNAAKDAGMDPADAQIMIQSVEDQVGDNAITRLWRAGEISEKGEPIVYLWEEGERVPIRLADGEFGQMMFEAITNMNKEWRNILTNALAIPATILRTGVTAAPDFIGANFFRDQASAAILTRNFIPGVDFARGVYDDLTISDLSRIYARAGGIFGGASTAAMHESRIKREVLQLRREGIRITLNPFTRDFWRLTEWSETGTRLGVFRRAFDRAKADGLEDWEAALEAAYASRDYIDFGRRGSRMHSARRIIPFFNAALQGIDRYVRQMRGRVDDDAAIREALTPYIKARTGQPLSVKERRSLPLSTKAWGGTVLLGVLGLMQSMLYEDDPEYEEMSDYIRATHWVFKVDGEWVRIPKPFEIAWMSNLFERTYEYAYKDDPTAWARLKDGLYEVVVPPHSIPGISIPTELSANYDYFTGRPIVGEHLKRLPPHLQFDAYSSEFGKFVGEQIGVSPAYVDHFITGFGASYGREFLNASDHLFPLLRGEEGPEASIHDYFFVRRFTKDVSRGSTSQQRFWDLVSRSGGKFTQAASGYRWYLEKAADPRGASEFLKGLNKEERAYALLEATKRGRKDAKLRKLHPLNRAQEIITVANKIRKEMNLKRLESSVTQERMTLSPTEHRMAREILSDIGMREARNALIALGERGWRQKEPMRTDTLMDELKEAVPEVYEEYVRRLNKQDLPSYEDVRESWPEARDRLLEDEEAAIIRDLYVPERL
jgi:hypothetical protein